MRLPASQRTREELTALIEGPLSTASAKDELIKLASRLIVEEALEGEAGDALGREYYEHGVQPGHGCRNGYRMGRLKTAEGLMEYSAPQIAGRDEPFRSGIREHLKGYTQGLEDLAIEMLARGLSVRDIEDAFKDEHGRLLLSKTAVQGPRGMRISKARAGLRNGKVCHRRWDAYGKLRSKGRRKSSPRSSTTSVSNCSGCRSSQLRRTPRQGWTA